MREFQGDPSVIRSAAEQVRGLGLHVQASARDTAPALLRVAHMLDGAASARASSSAGEAVAAALDDLTTALTSLGTGLHRAAEEYDLAERRQAARFR
jgi:uncharacterized protein YukE